MPSAVRARSSRASSVSGAATGTGRAIAYGGATGARPPLHGHGGGDTLPPTRVSEAAGRRGGGAGGREGEGARARPPSARVAVRAAAAHIEGLVCRVCRATPVYCCGWVAANTRPPCCLWDYGTLHSRKKMDEITEWVRENLQPVAPTLSGALAAAGAAEFADSLLTASVRAPPQFYAPGAVALLTLLALQLVPRHALADLDAAYDPAGATRARVWLFLCFVASFTSVAAGVSVVASAPPELAHVGGAALAQAGLTLAAGLLLWGFRTQGDDFGFMY